MPDSRLLSARTMIAIGIFAVAYFIQALVLHQIADTRHFLPDGDDMKFYNDWALRIAGGQWTDGKAFYGLPGYAYLLGILFNTFGYDSWNSPYLVGQIQAGLVALTCTLLFLIVSKVITLNPAHETRGPFAGILAASAWALFTPSQVYSAILMPTSWMICGFWGLVYWVQREVYSGRTSRWRPWLWMGLFAGVIATLVATILILIPLLLIAIVVVFREKCGRWTAIAGVLSGALACATSFNAAFDFSFTRLFIAFLLIGNAAIWWMKRPSMRAPITATAVLFGGVYAGTSPVWLHNRIVAKDTVFLSAHDGLNFHLGNHSTANGYTKIPPTLRATQAGLLRDSLEIPENEAGHPLKRSEVSAYWKAKGTTYISEHFTAWLSLLGVKAANFWNAFQYDDLSILKLLSDEGAVPPGLRFGFIAALALPGMIVCWRRWPGTRWVTAATLLQMTSLMPVFITERYRLCAAPGLIVVGIGGLVFLWEKIVNRVWIQTAIFIGLLVVSTWFVSRPQQELGLWSLDYYRAGTQSTKAASEARLEGNSKLTAAYLRHAQHNLETAFAYSPTNPEIVFALGNVWLYRNDLDAAERHYLQAVRLSIAANPDRGHDGALNNLGFIAMQRKRWADAEKFFLGSLKYEPEDANTWFLLADTRVKRGRTSEASEAIERALHLEPENPEFLKLRDELRQQP